MITMSEYMKRAGVSKKEYVHAWITAGLIPKVRRTASGEYLFPDSALRPYPQCKKKPKSASKIRAHIIKAALKTQFFNEKTFRLTKGEFKSYIDDLIAEGLIKERPEDGIVYYDSTLKSDAFIPANIRHIERCLKIVAPLVPTIVGVATAV